MTEDDLAHDLTRLLRDGLVFVDTSDDVDTDAPLRLALTARGRDVSSDAGLFRERAEPWKASA
jgi:hypothetical protein